jgi:hypothetical protein
MGPARDWVVTTQHVPKFRALIFGGKTPTSCLGFILSTWWLTVLLELYCLEEEEEGFVSWG